jgi:hypothetical protein
LALIPFACRLRIDEMRPPDDAERGSGSADLNALAAVEITYSSGAPGFGFYVWSPLQIKGVTKRTYIFFVTSVCSC